MTRTLIRAAIIFIGLFAVSVLFWYGFRMMSGAIDLTFDFDAAGEYTFDSALVDVSGGIASLIQKDQLDNDNTSTGFGGGSHSDTQYDGGNSWVELDATGMTNGIGTFTSRIMDAGGDVEWDSIAWETDSPSFKALPDSEGIETAYTNGNIDMTDNVLLLHMDEASWSGITDEVVDSSGNGNHGTAVGDADTTASGEKFVRSGDFDGTGDYVTIADDDSLSFGTEMSFSAWIYYDTDIGSKRIIEKGDGGGGSLEYRILNLDGGIFGFNDGLITQLSSDGSAIFASAACNGCLASLKDEWIHLAFVYNGTTLKQYINGVESGSGAGTLSLHNGTSPLVVGANDSGSFTLGPAKLDEVALWDRDLAVSEVTDIYERGTRGIGYQVRSCDDSACIGEAFIGPDGTAATQYTELLNTTTGFPDISLSSVIDNRYFQYQATMFTDDATLTPELKEIEIGPDHYDPTNPTIVNNAGLAFSSLNSFSEVPGGGNVGTVEYQLSNDGVAFYYYDGMNWTLESGSGYPTQTNTASEVNAGIGAFSSGVGTGDFYFKAFLHSDLGGEAVELDQVSLASVQPQYGGTPVVPIVNSFILNGGNQCTTNREVSVFFDVDDAEEMIISTHPEFLNATWQPYQENHSWTLKQAEGYQTVFAVFRSGTRNMSIPRSQSVFLDTKNSCNDLDLIPTPPEEMIEIPKAPILPDLPVENMDEEVVILPEVVIPDTVDSEPICVTDRLFSAFLIFDDIREEVRDLQELLQCLGYFPDSVPSTAIFGPITQDAVAEFQADRGIDSVGYVGPATREALNVYSR